MPVRPRSRASISARNCLPLRLSWCSSSSSGFAPLAITPPSASEIGGSGMMVASMRERTSESSSIKPYSFCNRGASESANAARKPGIFAVEAANAMRSRGFAVSSVTRLSRRSRSSTPASACRNSSRIRVCCLSSSTASSRARISLASSDGRSIHARNRRLPMGVTVESSERKSVTP